MTPVRVVFVLNMLAAASFAQHSLEVEKLLASNPGSSDYFGSDVAVADGVLAVAAEFNGTRLFREQPGSGWIEFATLPSGIAVELEAGRLFIGTTSETVQVYEEQVDGTWTWATQITKPGVFVAASQFGAAIDADGDRVLIGAPGDTLDPAAILPTFEGSAFVFERQVDGTWLEVAKLIPPSVDWFDQVGEVVALTGDHALIGSDGSSALFDDEGAVFAYRRQSSGSWAYIQTLGPSANTIGPGPNFGASLVAAGGRAFVGIPGFAGPGSNDGAVRIYEFSTGSGGWVLLGDILAPGSTTYSNFGVDIAFDGARLAVADPNRQLCGNTYRGSVHLFEELTPNTWSEVGRFVPDAHDTANLSVALAADDVFLGAPQDAHSGLWQPGAVYLFDQAPVMNAPTIVRPDASMQSIGIGGGEYLGNWIDVEGDRILATAFGANSGLGSAFIFERQTGGAWMQVAEFGLGAQATPFDYFGAGAELDGDRALIGAHESNGAAGTGTGAAYIFERQLGGTWTLAATLVPTDSAAWDQFGYAVELQGDRAVVSALLDDDVVADSGSVYVYERQGDGSWIEVAKLQPGVPKSAAGFGSYLSLDGDRMVVGSSSETEVFTGAGAAYLFERQGDGTWLEIARLADPSPAPSAAFGTHVSLDGDRVAVSAPGDAGSVCGAGSAFLFERQGDGSWFEVARFRPQVGIGEGFGPSVTVSGDRVVVGTQASAEGVSGAGTAIVYERRSDGSWVEVATFVDHAASTDEWFGVSVVLDGDRLVMGTWVDDPGNNAGSVFVADLGALYHGLPTLSVATGGVQEFVLRPGAEFAGDIYFFLGSLTGTAPGTFDPPSGLTLPLNFDAYTLLLINGSGAGLIGPWLGVFDAQGCGQSGFFLPAGTNPSFVGKTLHHAFMVIDTVTFGATLASNSVAVTLVP